MRRSHASRWRIRSYGLLWGRLVRRSGSPGRTPRLGRGTRQAGRRTAAPPKLRFPATTRLFRPRRGNLLAVGTRSGTRPGARRPFPPLPPPSDERDPTGARVSRLPHQHISTSRDNLWYATTTCDTWRSILRPLCPVLVVATYHKRSPRIQSKQRRGVSGTARAGECLTTNVVPRSGTNALFSRRLFVRESIPETGRNGRETRHIAHNVTSSISLSEMTPAAADKRRRERASGADGAECGISELDGNCDGRHWNSMFSRFTFVTRGSGAYSTCFRDDREGGAGMDLGFIRALYEKAPDQHGDRYVSVYLDKTTPSTGKAAAEAALRWRAVRERLAAE